MTNDYTDNYPLSYEEYHSAIGSEEMMWEGFDFDNTICRSVWPKPGIGEIIPGAKEALDYLTSKGFKIIIYTARPWSDYVNIERWCQDHKLPIRRIVCGKLLVRHLTDDRNVEFNPHINNPFDRPIKIITGEL